MRFACLMVAASAGTMPLAAACGDDDVPADTARSGSRLKLRWYEFESGLRTWRTDIFDSKFEMPCTPTEWRDGKERCTPALTQVMYLDAECSAEPIVVGGRAGDYAVSKVPSCGATLRHESMFQATAEAVAQPYVYLFRDSGLCERYETRDGTVEAVRATKLASPDLVTLDRVYQGDGRLRIETLSGSDGMLLPVRPYDSAYDAACTNIEGTIVSMSGVSSIPCLLDAPETQFYADEGCVTPGALVRESCEAPAEIVTTTVAGPCRPYFAVGDESQSDVWLSAGSCGTTQVSGARLFPATRALEPLTLERGPLPDAVGRVQPIYVGVGDTRVREPDVFYDAELETECGVQAVGNPITDVCFPSNPLVTQTLYSDAACTQTVFIAGVNSQNGSLFPCMEQAAPRYAVDIDSRELRPVGAEWTAPLYVAPSGGGCTAATFSNTINYALGPPIAAATFVRATRVLDLVSYSHHAHQPLPARSSASS